MILFKIFNFNRVGEKIKNLTKWMCWLGIALTWTVAATFFVVMIFNDMASSCWIPLLVALVVSFFTWIGSLTMYAFGELVDNSYKAVCAGNDNQSINQSTNKEKTERIDKTKPADLRKKAKAKRTYSEKTVVNQEAVEEEAEDFYVDITCPNCSKKLSFDEETTEAECPWCGHNIKIK